MLMLFSFSNYQKDNDELQGLLKLYEERLGNFNCDDDAAAISECESLGGDCIHNWIYSDDLSQNECLDLKV